MLQCRRNFFDTPSRMRNLLRENLTSLCQLKNQQTSTKLKRKIHKNNQNNQTNQKTNLKTINHRFLWTNMVSHRPWFRFRSSQHILTTVILSFTIHMETSRPSNNIQFWHQIIIHNKNINCQQLNSHYSKSVEN